MTLLLLSVLYGAGCLVFGLFGFVLLVYKMPTWQWPIITFGWPVLVPYWIVGGWWAERKLCK